MKEEELSWETLKGLVVHRGRVSKTLSRRGGACLTFRGAWLNRVGFLPGDAFEVVVEDMGILKIVKKGGEHGTNQQGHQD